MTELQSIIITILVVVIIIQYFFTFFILDDWRNDRNTPGIRRSKLMLLFLLTPLIPVATLLFIWTLNLIKMLYYIYKNS